MALLFVLDNCLSWGHRACDSIETRTKAPASTLGPTVAASQQSPTAMPAPADDPAVPVDTPQPTISTAPVPGSNPATSTIPLETLLEKWLRFVPLEFSDTLLVFSNYAVQSSRRTESESVFVPNGVALHDVFRERVVTLKELVGLDILKLNTSIWSWQPGKQTDTFFIADGPFDRDSIISNLVDLGYEEAAYSNTAYYGLDEDYAYDRSHPLRDLGLHLNRVSILEEKLLAAPSTGIIEGLIAAQDGAAPSLMDSGAHRALAEAAGEGLISGAFMPEQWIVDKWNTRNTGPIDRLDRYKDGPDPWGNLESYTHALFGYREQGGTEEIFVALHYPHVESAATDAQELEDRWNTFYYNPRGPVSGLEEVLASRSCSPFSTTAIEGAGYSVLVGSCPILRSEEDDPAVKGPSLWLWLFFIRELQFLVQDLATLE